MVDELNALLNERERRVMRAVAKAGDLAHGLKTPRAVLADEAQEARAAGQERVKLNCSKEGEQIVITIDDDGPGIDPSIQEAIMQRGVRADEGVPGSGLGLAIVRDVSEIYGGSISLGASPMGVPTAKAAGSERGQTLSSIPLSTTCVDSLYDLKDGKRHNHQLQYRQQPDFQHRHYRHRIGVPQTAA